MLQVTIKNNKTTKKQQKTHRGAQKLPRSVTEGLNNETTCAAPAFTVDHQGKQTNVTTKTSPCSVPNHARLDVVSSIISLNF